MSSLKKSQRSLRNWSKQDWGTKSGKPSAETGERYLPKKAIESLSDSEYAATTEKKREDTKKGKQFSKQPKKTARKTRQFRNVGGPINATQAPPEFLQEIGEYSKAEPYNPLAEKLQKSLDRQKKISNIAMMTASPVSKKKAAEKIYYHVTNTKNVKNIKEKGFNPLADTNFVKAGGDRYQKDMGLFLFTNPIAAFKFFHASDKYLSLDKKSIIPVKLKKGTIVKTDPSGDLALGSDAMNKLGLDKYAKQNYPTHSIFVSANNKKNSGNFLNKDIILGEGKTIKELIQNPKNPTPNKNWYPTERNVSDVVNNELVVNKQSKKQLQEYLKEIDRLIKD